MLFRRRFSIVIAIAAFLCGVTIAAPSSAANWTFESLDGVNIGPTGSTDSFVGNQSTTVVWNNQPHVFYLDSSNLDLRHAWWSGTAWYYETLDGAGGTDGRIDALVALSSSAVVWNNQPHVWYLDSSNRTLRHAWWSGSKWRFEALDGPSATGGNGRTQNLVGDYAAAAVWNGTPHVWYQDSLDKNLRHAWWTGAAWFFETLDGTCSGPCTNGRIDADVGRNNSVSTWNNTPHTWYLDYSNNDLRHGWWTGTAWQFETLDGSCGGTCTNGRLDTAINFAIAPTVWNKAPHVFYFDFDNANLRHAWWTGAAWQYETLDGEGGSNGRLDAYVGLGSAVAVWNGQPHVWYHDAENANLRHSWWTGSTWLFETLDGDAGANGRIDRAVGTDNSVVVWNNQPHDFYADQDAHDLRHAWYG